MKKVLTIALVFVMLMMVAMTVVNAATSETLADELYAIGAKYGMTKGNKIEIERYLKNNPIEEGKCNEILELAKEAQTIMQKNNTTDVRSLGANVKSELLSLANEAAEVAGVKSFTFDSKNDKFLVVGPDGEDYSISVSDALPYTGNEMNVALVVSSIAVIALAVVVATVATKTRLAANA